VERSARAEIDSNGLQVDTTLATPGEPRRYRVFSRTLKPVGYETSPAGIVFHTSEGPMAPFEEREAAALQRNSMELRFYARQRQSYHLLIDRFGRVYRLVEDSGRANHAGNSIWADSGRVYVNLNSSFLGVCFESVSRPGGEQPLVTPPQLHSGRLLIEVLRARHGIPAENCVTHAQVSVNPGNYRIGYHTDWAASFPFRELGLPDNYRQLLPSIALFGFVYDGVFVTSTGSRLWAGVLAAEEQVGRDATARGLRPAQHRQWLRGRYRDLASMENR
jgi:hypothetical protein